jgi:diguanylate cyclase (GGDEF)-like protein/putative nucleotidyltransferase with HDIG domain
MNTNENMPLGLVMMDVNGLKLINDAFGNATGDALLRNTAMLIRGASRPDDVIARVGGDEFAIIMPNTSMNTIEGIVMHLKEICNEIKVGEVTVSVSVGWADKQTTEEPMALVLKTAEDYMNKHKLVEGPSVRGKAIYAMVRTLHEKNKREEQHSIRVGELSERLGTALGLSSREMNDLKTMGLLHDVGKIAIEEYILNKPSRLTENEYNEIKKHPEIGYRILSSVNEMSEMAEYVFAHHEHWDGTGYPRGLKEFEIPYLARVISVVDAFDAMTSDRAYRQAMSYEQAYAELDRCAGQQFDPAIVKVFIKEMKKSV